MDKFNSFINACGIALDNAVSHAYSDMKGEIDGRMTCQALDILDTAHFFDDHIKDVIDEAVLAEKLLAETAVKRYEGARNSIFSASSISHILMFNPAVRFPQMSRCPSWLLS